MLILNNKMECYNGNQIDPEQAIQALQVTPAFQPK
jgi:hypothetical protein